MQRQQNTASVALFYGTGSSHIHVNRHVGGSSRGFSGAVWNTYRAGGEAMNAGKAASGTSVKTSEGCVGIFQEHSGDRCLRWRDQQLTENMYLWAFPAIADACPGCWVGRWRCGDLGRVCSGIAGPCCVSGVWVSCTRRTLLTEVLGETCHIQFLFDAAYVEGWCDHLDSSCLAISSERNLL